MAIGRKVYAKRIIIIIIITNVIIIFIIVIFIFYYIITASQIHHSSYPMFLTAYQSCALPPTQKFNSVDSVFI